MSSHLKDKRIAVVGGGLGGLAFANAAVYNKLSNVNVYEQAKQFREIGAGVHITKNAYLILDRYGMKSEMERIAAIPSRIYMQYRHYKSGEIIAEALEPTAPYGRRVHRAHLLDVMRHNLPQDILHTNKHLERMEKVGDEYNLYFSDGTTVTADIVIGCDGIHSKVRQFLGITDDPNYSGQVVYRGVIPKSSLPDNVVDKWQEMCLYRGLKRHILIYPIGQGEEYRINIVAFMSEDLKDWHSESWMAKAHVSNLEEHVKAWHPDISQHLIKALADSDSDGQIMKQALYVREPIDKWYEEGVVLLGDAVHSTLPHQGQGTGMAIESGAALAYLLSTAKQEDKANDVFARFKALRKPRADKITRTSEIAGQRGSSTNPDDVNQGDFTPEKIKTAWNWITEYDVIDALKQL